MKSTRTGARHGSRRHFAASLIILILLALMEGGLAQTSAAAAPLKILSDSRHAYNCITSTIDLLLGTGHVGTDIIVHSTNMGTSGPFSVNVRNALATTATYYDELGNPVSSAAPYLIFTSSCTGNTGDNTAEYNLSTTNDLAYNYGYSADLPAGTPPPAFRVSPGYGGYCTGPGVEWVLDTSEITTGSGTLSCAEGANAGMMTVLRHNHPTWNWLDVKAALRQTGSNWATGYNQNAYGFGQVNYATANSFTDNQLLLQPPEVKASLDSMKRVQFELYPFKQTRRVKDVLYQFPSAPSFQDGELTLDMITALGGTKVADYTGTAAQVLQPLTQTAVNAYFVWFTADNGDDRVAHFSRIDTYCILGPFSQTIVPITTASPDQGTYYAPQTVSLTCSEGNGGCGNTYYTTDGTDPTTNSSLYSSPIVISSTTTLKFFSLGNNNDQEPVNTKTYTILPASSAPPVPALGPWGLCATAAILGGTVFSRRKR
jgi:hypothetical protein